MKLQVFFGLGQRARPDNFFFVEIFSGDEPLALKIPKMDELDERGRKIEKRQKCIEPRVRTCAFFSEKAPGRQSYGLSWTVPAATIPIFGKKSKP